MVNVVKLTKRVGAAARPRGWRRWGRRGWRGVVGLTVLGLAGHTWWAWSSERALEREVAGYAAAGEAIYRADLAEAAVADAENAVPPLREAGRLVNGASGEWRTFAEVDAGWGAGGAGARDWFSGRKESAAGVGVRVDRGAGSAARVEPFLNEKYARAVRAALAANEGALAKLDVALARPGAWWGPRDDGRPLLQSGREEIANALQLASLLRAAALAAHHEGDDVEALRRVGQMLTLSGVVDRQGTCPAHAVACAVAAVAARTAAEVAADLRVPAAGAGVARALAARFLDGGPLHEGQARALRFTRVMLWDTAGQVAGGRADLLRTAENAPAIRAGRLGCYACKPLLMEDGRLMVRYASGVMGAAARASDWPEYLAASPADPPEVIAWPRLHFLAAVLLPDFRWYVRGHFRAVAQCRLAAVALAAGDYASGHGGRGPGAVGELVPVHLPYVPRDPMAAGGRAIGWAATAGGGARVYSVGDDGVDDGGSEVRPGDAGKAGRRVWGTWDRRDFVVRVGRE